MKSLFKNYSLELNKNEKKIISQFLKQAVKQMQTDNRFFADTKAFNSVLEKLQTSDDKVKLTKDEYVRLSHQLRENSKHLKKQIEKAGFFKKWMYKSLYNQYSNILQNHFSDK